MADERTAEAVGAESVVGADAVGGVGEVPLPPGVWQTPDEGKGRASGDLRTAMEGMEVGGDNMEKGGVEEAEHYDAEADGEGVGVGWGGLLALEATGILNQDTEPGGTTLVDDPPGNALGGEAPLHERGKVHVQLLQALGTASPLPAW